MRNSNHINRGCGQPLHQRPINGTIDRRKGAPADLSRASIEKSWHTISVLTRRNDNDWPTQSASYHGTLLNTRVPRQASLKTSIIFRNSLVGSELVASWHGDASAAQAEDSANPRSDKQPSLTLPFWHESARHSRVERAPKRKCAAPTGSEAGKWVCPKCKEDQGSRQLYAHHYTDETSWRVRPRAASAHARTHDVHQRV